MNLSINISIYTGDMILSGNNPAELVLVGKYVEYVCPVVAKPPVDRPGNNQ